MSTLFCSGDLILLDFLCRLGNLFELFPWQLFDDVLDIEIIVGIVVVIVIVVIFIAPLDNLLSAFVLF